MRRTLSLVSTCLGVAALALTAGCEDVRGLQTYPTEVAAAAACGEDEVVYGWFMNGRYYVTKASPSYGTLSHSDGQYACLGEMTRMRLGCGMRHDPAEGPLPYALAPACYNVPGKPKA
jgi:hypothetical protein